MPAPARAVTAFYDRPYRTVDPAVAEGLLSGITDPEVTRLPALLGSIEQWADRPGLAPGLGREALQAVYRRRAGP
jgi:hypothetical protein